MDEPVVWYEGADLSNRRFLQADERGSIVAISNASGNVVQINTYDEYGTPSAGNIGRFQYTGQTWFAEAGLYNYKARFYSPYLGRFLQADPIGYGDGLNRYGYVGNDPINFIDPSGLSTSTSGQRCQMGDLWCDGNPWWTPWQQPRWEGVPYRLPVGPPAALPDQGTVSQEKNCLAPTNNASTIVLPIAGVSGAAGQSWLAAALARASVLLSMLTLSGDTVQQQLNIPLFRAVGSVEFAQIQATGQYAPSPNAFGQKQFWTNLSDAQWYANAVVAKGWDPTSTIVQSSVTQQTFSMGTLFSDAGHPAVSFPDFALPAVNADAARSGGIIVVQTCGDGQ
jgi:RHS repeat-associated protein